MDLVLIDTGLGTQDLENPRRLGLMSYILGVQGHAKESALKQIQKLGYNPKDVRHLIPTHLDLDHAGGINDFPDAIVHTLKPEFEAAMKQTSIKDKHRYRDCHWSKNTLWQVHDLHYGEPWFGFDAVREIPGLPPEILLVPLFGHTKGHFGVAIKTNSGWFLHAGDAFYSQSEMTPFEKTLPGWFFFQKIVHDNYKLALKNQQRLKQLNQKGDVQIFSSHDALRFAQVSK